MEKRQGRLYLMLLFYTLSKQVSFSPLFGDPTVSDESDISSAHTNLA